MIKTQNKSARFFSHFEPFLPKIPVRLKSKPHFGCGLKISPKSKCSLWSYAPFSAANFIDNNWSCSNLTGEFALRKIQGLQKFLFKYFAWVNGVFHSGFGKFHLFVPLNYSMIVTDFNFNRSISLPSKDNAPLNVDSNRVETLSIAFQCFEMVARWTSQVTYFFRCIKDIQFKPCDAMKFFWQALSSCLGIKIKRNVACTLRGIVVRLHPASLIPVISYNSIRQGVNCKVLPSLAVFVIVGCVSRAPTDCELDKRSGLYPSSFCEGKTDKGSVEPIHGAAASNVKPNEIPVRSEPLVKRVWIHDQILEGGHWMQGTWAYIEVEPSKWVGTSTRPSSPSVTTKPGSIKLPELSKERAANNHAEKSTTRSGGKQ